MYARDRGEPPVLAMRGVEVRLCAGAARCTVMVRALRGVELTVGAGELVAVCGEAASGKTVLLLTAAGLLPPALGEVRRVGTVLVADATGAWRAARGGPCLVLADDVPDAMALRKLRARAAPLAGAAVLAAMRSRSGVARAELEARAAGARVVRLALGRLSAGSPRPVLWHGGGVDDRVASVAEPS